MAKKNPVVLVHGYSDEGKSFRPWADVLRESGYDVVDINIVTYESLTNEVTIKDIAEAFDRALRAHKALADEQRSFDVICHSTGMLVVRAWLTAKGASPQRMKRLKHLIGFAPATFGSPLAHKGRGWLGTLAKGNRHLGPDFLEAGDLVLDGLELGSRFTWDLAHVDLFGPQPYYGRDNDTPYPFIFVGNEPYKGFLREEFVNQEGTDGTVRWAGTPLDSRKLTMNLTVRPGTNVKRLNYDQGQNEVHAPAVFVNDRNHGSIMSEPEEAMRKLVVEALEVDSHEKFVKWTEKAEAYSKGNEPSQRFQQFVVRMIDERGDPVPDYNVALFTMAGDKMKYLKEFEVDVHSYARDTSLRCFHADVGKVQAMKLDNLWMQFMLSSGTILVGYRGFSTVDPPPPVPPDGLSGGKREEWLLRRPTEINIKLDTAVLFRPFTTTMVEITIDREPLPVSEIARLCRWIDVS